MVVVVVDIVREFVAVFAVFLVCLLVYLFICCAVAHYKRIKAMMEEWILDDTGIMQFTSTH